MSREEDKGQLERKKSIFYFFLKVTRIITSESKVISIIASELEVKVPKVMKKSSISGLSIDPRLAKELEVTAP